MRDTSTRSAHRATLADIARSTGVSVATASYVLSNRPGVTISAATRERVLDCANSLGYRRNALAAALRAGSSREIGLYSATRPRGSEADIAFALAESAGVRNYSLVIHIGEPNAFDPGRFEAVIALGSLPPQLLEATRISNPCVEIGSSSATCQVHADDFGGSRRGVEYLLSLGHRRIAHFAGPQTEPSSQERLRGFLDAVHEAGLRMDATPVFHSMTDLVKLLGAPLRPTAILAHDDEGAVAVYRCARAASLRVPTDLSIVGFGDEPFASLLLPGLTSMSISPTLIAETALNLLERQLARIDVPTLTLIPTTLVVRESATPPI